jgi:hypothetical protein
MLHDAKYSRLSSKQEVQLDIPLPPEYTMVLSGVISLLIVVALHGFDNGEASVVRRVAARSTKDCKNVKILAYHTYH